MGYEPFLGQVKCFAFAFAPRGWAQCAGQLLPINQNQALFSLLGTTYGGNGTSNFALPDLRGRAPIHAGTGPGLTARTLGAAIGEASHALSAAEIPAHTHTVSATTLEGDSATPAGAFPTKSGAGDARFGTPGQAGAGAMHAGAIASAGSSQAHQNMMPSLCMNYCIALQGIYPSRP
ncbi:MAG TPA: tail fiber protein [Phycisphaerales bacterium]|nr:tail fiber protein [Phycisphaerales bacterium]